MKPALLPLFVGVSLLTFQSANATIAVTEFFANPSALADVAGEFVEIYNSGPTSVDLSGWILKDGAATPNTVPLSGTLGVGQLFVVALSNDLAVFKTHYGVTALQEPFLIDGGSGSFLNNTGAESIVLNDGTSDIWSFVYSGGVANGASAYLDHSYDLSLGAPGSVTLTAVGDYINQGVANEPGMRDFSGDLASPFAWAGHSVPEPSTGLLVILAGALIGSRRRR